MFKTPIMTGERAPQKVVDSRNQNSGFSFWASLCRAMYASILNFKSGKRSTLNRHRQLFSHLAPGLSVTRLASDGMLSKSSTLNTVWASHPIHSATPSTVKRRLAGSACISVVGFGDRTRGPGPGRVNWSACARSSAARVANNDPAQHGHGIGVRVHRHAELHFCPALRAVALDDSTIIHWFCSFTPFITRLISSIRFFQASTTAWTLRFRAMSS